MPGEALGLLQPHPAGSRVKELAAGAGKGWQSSNTQSCHLILGGFNLQYFSSKVMLWKKDSIFSLSLNAASSIYSFSLPCQAQSSQWVEFFARNSDFSIFKKVENMP